MYCYLVAFRFIVRTRLFFPQEFEVGCVVVFIQAQVVSQKNCFCPFYNPFLRRGKGYDIRRCFVYVVVKFFVWDLVDAVTCEERVRFPRAYCCRYITGNIFRFFGNFVEYFLYNFVPSVLKFIKGQPIKFPQNILIIYDSSRALRINILCAMLHLPGAPPPPHPTDPPLYTTVSSLTPYSSTVPLSSTSLSVSKICHYQGNR